MLVIPLAEILPDEQPGGQHDGANDCREEEQDFSYTPGLREG